MVLREDLPQRLHIGKALLPPVARVLDDPDHSRGIALVAPVNADHVAFHSLSLLNPTQERTSGVLTDCIPIEKKEKRFGEMARQQGRRSTRSWNEAGDESCSRLDRSRIGHTQDS